MTDTNDDELMTLEQASGFLQGRVSEELVRRALAGGELRGRNLGGSVGWLTTRREIIEWIRRGNSGPSRTDVRTKAKGGGDGTREQG